MLGDCGVEAAGHCVHLNPGLQLRRRHRGAVFHAGPNQGFLGLIPHPLGLALLLRRCVHLRGTVHAERQPRERDVRVGNPLQAHLFEQGVCLLFVRHRRPRYASLQREDTWGNGVRSLPVLQHAHGRRARVRLSLGARRHGRHLSHGHTVDQAHAVHELSKSGVRPHVVARGARPVELQVQRLHKHPVSLRHGGLLLLRQLRQAAHDAPASHEQHVGEHGPVLALPVDVPPRHALLHHQRKLQVRRRLQRRRHRRRRHRPRPPRGERRRQTTEQVVQHAALCGLGLLLLQRRRRRRRRGRTRREAAAAAAAAVRASFSTSTA
eukprot:Rhum_TRINITY_DN14516_c4_g1::Rhum_TRINITY_DN14516_c4_g1_i1::g.94477::m.94477